MIKKIAADQIYIGDGSVLEDTIIILDEFGKVLELDRFTNHDPSEIDRVEGLIVPGFINTHCHLELSHMKANAPTGTGLVSFISHVVSSRDIPQEEIDEAIVKGDEEMWNEGIVAVGDISNKLDTAFQKEKSKIRYYTFVEAFDFLDDSKAEEIFGITANVFSGQSRSKGNQVSVVPHAPYTVSKSLFQKINEINASSSKTVSIHNQETVHENDFFLKKQGEMLKFYQNFDLPLSHFEATKQTSIHYALENMDPSHRTLFVHNTLTNADDYKAAINWNKEIYFASCPNANLYIENRLPDYQMFLDLNAKMTLGTDSLTSNWQLSILEEMKTIQKYNSFVPFNTLIQWATLNGAEALGFDDDLGSISVGKTPGINVLQHEGCKMKFDLQKASVKKLV